MLKKIKTIRYLYKKDMKDRVEQAIKRIEGDLEMLSFKAKGILSEQGEFLRSLNDLINEFEAKKMDIESKINAYKMDLTELNEAEVEKRAQLKILKDIVV